MRKIRLLALLLAIITVFSCFAACGGDDEDDDGDAPTDDYNGSIADPEEPGDDDDTEAATYVPAEGTADAVVEIHTANDLVTKLTRKGTFVLMADIDLTNVDYKPFGNYMYPFEGKLQGNGHKITGLKITAVTGEAVGPAYITYKYAYSGLFGATKNAEITDLTVEGADVSYSTNTEYCYSVVGILAGYMTDTKVSGCSVSGKVYSKSTQYYAYGGGICGMLSGGRIENVTVNAEVTTDGSSERAVSGGITAYVFNGSEIFNCSVDGTVKAISSYGVAYCGGIAGYTRHVTVSVCKNEADIYAEALYVDSYKGTAGSANAGGIVGMASSESETNRSKIVRCYSINSSVTSKGNASSAYAGGISAKVMMADFTDSYSRSDVAVSSDNKTVYVGSAFGLLEKEYAVKGCFAYGNVSVTHPNIHQVYIGGFSGYPIRPNTERLKNCVYNVNASFTVNGEAAPAVGPSATPISAGMFTLSALKNTLQWKDGEWRQEGDTLIPTV